MNKYDRKYVEKQIRTVAELRKLYNDAYKKIIAGIPLTKLSPEEQFAFEKYPELEKKFNQTTRALDIALLAYINNSTREVWDLANDKNTEIINNQFAGQDSKPPPSVLKTNIPEYEKFINRKIGDLTLSDRVWNINGTNFKEEIELAINAAIREGKSAADTARDIQKYLNNPTALFRRVRDAEGNLQLSKAAKAYRPGQGVYRSAYKNALRLTRTEINSAYRESAYLRMQENDSIIGFRIQNSNRIATVCELCKRFNGLIFPKTFRWLGFHVQCMCTSTAVFASDAEVAAWKRGEAINPELPKMPEEFVMYQGELQEKIKTKSNIKNDEVPRELKGITFSERYEGKNGGYLYITKQNSNEYKDNIKTYKILADNGGKYALLPPSNTQKSPDAFNIERKWYSDAKNTNSNNGKNIIQNSVKSASRQGADEVVIRMLNEVASTELFDGLKAALQPGRAVNIKQIILIRNKREPLCIDAERLREHFKIKAGS